MQRAPAALSIEQVATLTDADIVRRRFDAGNAKLISSVAAIAFFVAVGQLLGGAFSRSMERSVVPLSVLHVVFSLTAAALFGELAYAEKRKPRLPVDAIARNLTPFVLAFLIIEFTLLTLFRAPRSSAWLAWAMGMPWVFVFVRLSLGRRTVLHAALLVVVAVNVAAIGSTPGNQRPEYVSIFGINAFALLIGGVMSRRVRLQTLEEWTERRAVAREQVRMRDELQYAREVQLSMLPESAPLLEWVDLAGISLPATEVGGDYFEYFTGDGAVSIVCADVAGHGLASGIVLASLRAGFMLLRDSLAVPASVLQRLNRLVAETSRRRMLATAAVVRLDRRTRRASIASAGHPPVLFRRNGSSRAIELFAPPLGVRLPYDVPSTEIELSSGDVFVLHTDGVYEAVNGSGESYGIERLARALDKSDATSAAAVRDTLIRDVERFRGAVAQADDVTVVVARVLAWE